MVDISLVIKIPEEQYRTLNAKSQNDVVAVIDSALLIEAIKNGTPLLNNFDLEGLKQDMKALNCGFPYGLDYLLDCIKNRLGITIEQT